MFLTYGLRNDEAKQICPIERELHAVVDIGRHQELIGEARTARVLGFLFGLGRVGLVVEPSVPPSLHDHRKAGARGVLARFKRARSSGKACWAPKWPAPSG